MRQGEELADKYPTWSSPPPVRCRYVLRVHVPLARVVRPRHPLHAGAWFGVVTGVWFAIGYSLALAVATLLELP